MQLPTGRPASPRIRISGTNDDDAATNGVRRTAHPMTTIGAYKNASGFLSGVAVRRYPAASAAESRSRLSCACSALWRTLFRTRSIESLAGSRYSPPRLDRCPPATRRRYLIRRRYDSGLDTRIVHLHRPTSWSVYRTCKTTPAVSASVGPAAVPGDCRQYRHLAEPGNA